MDRLSKSIELLEADSESFILEGTSYIASLDTQCKRWTSREFREVLSSDIRVTSNADVVLFVNLDSDSVSKLRERFGLHPVIDAECSNFSPKDQMLELGDHLLISFSVFDSIKTELSAVHIIFFYNKLLVFSNSPLYSLARMSRDEGFSNFLCSVNLDYFSEENCLKVEQECFDSEKILIKMIGISLYRIYSYIMFLEEETKFYLSYSTDFVVRYSFLNLKKVIEFHQVLSRIKNVLGPKKRLINEMLDNFYVRDEMKVYLLSLKQRAISLKRKTKEVLSLVKATEHVYEIAQEERLRRQNQDLDKFSEIFEANATIWIPLLYIIAMNSINVIIPCQFVENTTAFSYWTAAVFASCIVLFIYLKFKNLI